MYAKKLINQEFVQALKSCPFVIVLHFNAVSVSKWKELKNSMYKMDPSTQIQVVKGKSLKKSLENTPFEKLSPLCQGPTCFLFCSSFSTMKLFFTTILKLPAKNSSNYQQNIDNFSVIGGKCQDIFINELDLKKMVSLKENTHAELLKVTFVKTRINTVIHKILLKLPYIFKANNGN